MESILFTSALKPPSTLPALPLEDPGEVPPVWLWPWRYCSIRFASFSLLSSPSSNVFFCCSRSRVISSCTRLSILYRSTFWTTPANCADSRRGSAKPLPRTRASSSVAIYVESTAWPTFSIEATRSPDSESEKAL